MSGEPSFFQEFWWQILLGIAAIAGPMIAFVAWRWPRAPKGTTPQPLPGRDPGPSDPPGPTNTTTIPRAVGFVDRPKLLKQILSPPAQPPGMGGSRIAAICSLHGMGGIGKTELARETARRLEPENGIAEVNLRGWDSGQPMGEEEALRTLCLQIDPATDPQLSLPQLQAHWRAITAAGSLVVILDNLREPQETEKRLIDALRPTRGMTLITGRERIYRAGIELVEVDVMEPQEAADLAIATHPALLPEEAAVLAKAVGYLPLAVSLAAAYLARTGETADALERRIGQAAGGDGRTLQGLFERVVDLSTADLGESEKARWLALSLPPGDFGLWAAQALWQDDDPLPELGELVHRHLVLPAGEGRWRLHDLLRHYGRSVLAKQPEREQALWRQLGLMAVLRLAQIDDRFESGGDAMVPALAELDAELPVLRAVQTWAAERIEQDKVAAEVASGLPNHSITQFRLVGDEVLAWRQMSLHAAEHRGRKEEIAAAAGNLGLVHRERGEWEEALAMTRKCLAIADELGDRAGMAADFGNLGSVHLDLGQLEEALGMYQKGLAINEELGNRAGMAANYGNLGLVHRRRGELEEALAIHRKSLAIEEELGNRAGMARQYGNLGLVHRQRGELEEALTMHRKSLAVAEELGDRAGMAANYGNLGLVHKRRGDWEEAATLHRKKIEINEDMGNRPELATGLYNLGAVLVDQGDWAGAAEHFRRSLALAEELGLPDDRIQSRRQALAEAEAQLAGGANAEGGPGSR